MLGDEEQCVEEEQVSEAAEAKRERAEKLKQLKMEADQTTTLYLFGRTGREKEEWYQHFLLASKTEIYREKSKSGAELNTYVVKLGINIFDKFKFNAERSKEKSICCSQL